MRDDGTGFDAFYAATYRRTLHQMFAMLADAGEAADVTQEAYERAWSDWRRVSAMADPQAWVRTVAWRIAANRLRHLRTAARRVRLLPSRGEEEPSAEASVDLVAALRRIPADQRRVLVLHYLVDLPLDQVADEVGASVSAVKSRLARGRAALAPLLGDGSLEERHA